MLPAAPHIAHRHTLSPAHPLPPAPSPRLSSRAADGLHMRVTSGTATVLEHQFDLVGFEARVPLKGYFTYAAATNELTLHIIDFKADFEVHVDEPVINGNFEVSGWMTELGTAGVAQLATEPAPRVALAATDATSTRSLAEAAVKAAGLMAGIAMAAVLVAAAKTRAFAKLRGTALATEDGAQEMA